MTISESTENLAAAAALLGRPWTMLIIDALGTGPLRFNEILRQLPGVSTNLLSERLRQLQNAAMVTRNTTDVSRAVVYDLTPLGRTLIPILLDLANWATGLPDLRRK